eukprot:3782141-Alexandrium_andersonii.AAC.1
MRGMAAQHARECRPIPQHAQGRMDRGMAAFDLVAAGGPLEEPESSIGVDDADIADIADFRA